MSAVAANAPAYLANNGWSAYRIGRSRAERPTTVGAWMLCSLKLLDTALPPFPPRENAGVLLPAAIRLCKTQKRRTNVKRTRPPADESTIRSPQGSPDGWFAVGLMLV